MKNVFGILILVSMLAVVEGTRVDAETSATSEILRGFVTALRANAMETGPCLAVVPQMQDTLFNMTMLHEAGDYWGVFFEVVDYTAEFVLLIDKCEMPEFWKKVKRTATENGISEILLKVGMNYPFYLEQYAKIIET
mgnify:CR=1 FL=1